VAVRGRLPDVLNDARWPLRTLTFALGVPLGLIGSTILVQTWHRAQSDEPALAATPLLMLSAAPLFLLVVVLTVVLLNRTDRRLRQRAGGPHRDPSRIASHGSPAAGRVVRTRPERGGTHVVVCTALAPGGARRVVAATPYAGLRAGQPVALLLDPDDTDVAVLDDRVGPGDLAAIDADPRWRTWTLPTERRVAGGWSGVALAGLLGALAGGGVSLGVLALVA